jgi:predicted NAD/FAD-dependent oxidoreductase
VRVSEFGATRVWGVDLNLFIASAVAGGFKHAADTWVMEMASSAAKHSAFDIVLLRIGTPQLSVLIENLF